MKRILAVVTALVLLAPLLCVVGCDGGDCCIGPDPDPGPTGPTGGGGSYVQCGKNKVYVCHVPPGNPDNEHTICIARPAVPVHIARGSYLGACSAEDADGDGTPDGDDVCPDDPDDDGDGDGLCADDDNCPEVDNPGQEDGDSDGVGDACDNCPDDANDTQDDADQDGLGDACDACPGDPDNDVDQDGICGDVDNCPDVANPGQEDADGDGIGDACDS
jgi:hypothetical protein